MPLKNTGKYILKIVSIGYETPFFNFTLVKNNQQVNLDTLSIKQSYNAVSEVVVTGKKNHSQQVR